ncbi:MAG: caspase family protein [Chloroflexota bacterium]
MRADWPAQPGFVYQPVRLSQSEAAETLLQGIKNQRVKPVNPPGFPGVALQHSLATLPPFPSPLPPSPQPIGAASRLRDLEKHIQDTQKLIREYEQKIRLSSEPRELVRSRQEIKTLQSLRRKYQKEHDHLSDKTTISVPAPANPGVHLVSKPGPPSRPVSSINHFYALIIGIGKYEHIQPLAKTTVDAQDVLDLLAQAGVPSAQCSLLLDEHASKGNINDALDSLARKVKAEAEATVLLFFSGHGAQRVSGFEQGEYLCPVETDWYKLRETAISNLELTSALRAIPAKRMLVCLDACHSGGVGEARDASLNIKNGLSESGYASTLRRK